MPSPNQRSVDLPLLTFGGKVSQYDPQTLPSGASPFCQDVVFSGVDPSGAPLVAGVASRPGMGSGFYAAPFAANPTVNYLKTFVDSTAIYHLLSLDGLGNMRDESPCSEPPGVPAIIGNVVAASLAQSDSLINREWIAISSPLHPGFGIDIPRQWDGTNFDRVSQVGPGAPPAISANGNEIPILTITQPPKVTGLRAVNWSGNPGSGSKGNLITLYYSLVPAAGPNTTSDPNIYVGAWVYLTGFPAIFAVPSINGLYQITSVQVLAGAGGQYNTFTVQSAISESITYTPPAGAGYQATLATVTLSTPTTTVLVGSTVSITGTTVVSWNVAWTVLSILVTSSFSITNTVLAGGIATYTFALLPNPLTNPPVNYAPPTVGQLVSVAGTFNGGGVFNVQNAPILAVVGNTFQIAITGPNVASAADTGTGNVMGTQFTIDPSQLVPQPTDPIFGNATGGDLSGTGLINNGLRGCAVSFITREQYISKPSPPVYFNLENVNAIVVSQIPIGPPNVIARIIMFTPVITPPANTGPFFYFDGPVVTPTDGTFPSMVIQDNTTTQATFNFVDAVLENGVPADNLFDLLELGECSSACAYSGRMFWCGERNKLPNYVNFTFDGGFNGNNPLGWTSDPINGGGGGPSPNPYWGGAYRITGDGNAADLGMITQPILLDYLGVNILNINTAYSMRVRLAKGGGITTGAVTFGVYSPSQGVLGTFTVNQAAIPDNGYEEFIGSLMPSFATLPADIVYRVFASATFDPGAFVDIDCIELYPSLQPYNNTLIRGSYAEDPESFDQTTGFLIVGPDNGYPAKAMFNLLDSKLYIVTELGLYSTQDDNSNEPSLWAINTVSATMGTGSARGVGVGESWAVIAHKTGAYIFWGGEPVKISQEIQPDWDTINWEYDQTIYVVVDTTNKRVHIGAPVGESTVPNVEFVLDYSQLANAEGQVSGQDIASHPQAYYSVYNPTKVVAPGKARKWTLWNISMNCAALTIRSAGSYLLLRGNATGTGKVYEQNPTNLNDDGVAINAQYQTAFFPTVEDEQQLQLGSHRKTVIYLTSAISGAGTMSWTIYGAYGQRSLSLHSDALQNPPYWGDQEKNVNWVGERASLLFGTHATTAWWKMVKLCPTLQREIVSPVRGVN